MPLTGRARWLAFLNRIDPRVTKMVDSLGRVINQADSMVSTLTVATRLGRCYRSYWSGTVGPQETIHLIVLPPAGVTIVGHSRVSQVEGGRVVSRFAVGGSYSVVDETIIGHNFDETLQDQAQSNLLKVSDLTGQSYRDSGAPIVPQGVFISRPSVQTQVGADPRFNQTRFPVFEYANPDEQDSIELWIDIVWEEEPGPPV